MIESIFLKGCRERNLKNIDLAIPHNKITLISGISGAGKSTLAFETLFNESQRRYLEVFSPRSRRLLQKYSRSSLISASGVLPAIAVRQDKGKYHDETILAEATDIDELIALFYLHHAGVFCPNCHQKVEKVSPLEAAKKVLNKHKNQICAIIAAIEANKGEMDLTSLVLQLGFTRVFVNQSIQRVEDWDKKSLIQGIIVDKVIIADENIHRLQESMILASKLGQGLWAILDQDNNLEYFSNRFQCQKCWTIVPQPMREFLVRMTHKNKQKDFHENVTNYLIDGLSVRDLYAFSIKEFKGFIFSNSICESSARFELTNKLSLFSEAGLSYLSLERKMNSLSGGERQRVSLLNSLGLPLSQTLYCIDEPMSGLHPLDTSNIKGMIQKIKNMGNTVVVVGHDRSFIDIADQTIVLGPGSGKSGGSIISDQEFYLSEENAKRQFISQLTHVLPEHGCRMIRITANHHNLKEVHLELPLNLIVGICGVSGSGKSSLMMEAVPRSWQEWQETAFKGSISQGFDHIDDIFLFHKAMPIRSVRSNLATYLGLWQLFRDMLAKEPAAQREGLTARDFSFNLPGGRCEVCSGLGGIEEDLDYLGTITAVCPSCLGDRFGGRVLEIKVRGKNVSELLRMSLCEAAELFYDLKDLQKAASLAESIGIGHLPLGLGHFSGGEAQRMRLLQFLLRIPEHKKLLLIFDEPCVGLADSDIYRLYWLLRSLQTKGHSLVVIEHRPALLAGCDYFIELGYGAGDEGGAIVASLAKEEFLRAQESRTAPFIRSFLT